MGATPISTGQQSVSKRQHKVIGADKMLPAPKKTFPKHSRINEVDVDAIQPIKQKSAKVDCGISIATFFESMTSNRDQEIDNNEVDNIIRQDTKDENFGEKEIVIVEDEDTSEANHANELEVLVDEVEDDDDFV